MGRRTEREKPDEKTADQSTQEELARFNRGDGVEEYPPEMAKRAAAALARWRKE